MNINDDDKFAEIIGRKLHFLQDMTMPLHVESGSFAKKVIDYVKHIKFEIITVKHNQNVMSKKYLEKDNTNKLTNSNSFEKLFFDAVEGSKIENKNRKIKYSNGKDWKNIAQDNFDRAVDITKEYLVLMSNFINK